MLSKIEAVNFLSYSNIVQEFKEGEFVVLEGDNGHGKSALFETLPFAYFGIGRYTYISEYARFGNPFKVKITHKDIPLKGDILVVERGYKADSKGYAFVKINNKIIAKGIRGNCDVSSYIKNDLMVSVEQFMLTSFYGLEDSGRSDTLLSADPATCADTLQSLARVSIFLEFQKNTNKRLKKSDPELQTKKMLLDNLKENTVSISSLNSSLKEKNNRLIEIEIELKEKKKYRDGLSIKEDKYKSLVNSKKLLQESIDELDDSLDDKETTLDSLNKKIISFDSERDRLVKNNDTLCVRLKEFEDDDVLREKINALTSELSKANTFLELKNVAIEIDINDDLKCPLCDNKIGFDIINNWKKDIENIQSNIKVMLKESKINKDNESEKRKLVKSLDSCKKEIQSILERLNDAEELRKTVESELKKVKDKLNDKKSQMKIVISKISDDYIEIIKDINECDSNIDGLQIEFGSLSSDIEHIKQLIKSEKEKDSKIKSLNKEIIKLEVEVAALNHLVTLYGRYEIPMHLMKDLRRDIENRATEIYKEFENGSIKIEDVEGKRPGIRFVLIDQKGKRPWRGLSKGEKSMFYFSVRVAISEIESGRSTNFGYVVFDEGMGNLSQEKIKILVRVINKRLRKIFPQVFAVTHIGGIETVDRKLRVSMENGESVIS